MLFKKGGNRYKLSFIKVDREIAKAESQIAKLKKKQVEIEIK